MGDVPGRRDDAVRALRRIVVELDEAFATLAPVRPRQARRWAEVSRARYLRAARPDGPGTGDLWSFVGDLRRLLNDACQVMADDLGREPY